MKQEPVLTQRRRQILYLRVSGYSYRQIADRLGLKPRTIRFHMDIINNQMFRGLGNTEGESNGFRIAYVLGLLHGGVDPEQIESYLIDLDRRTMTLEEQMKRSPRPNSMFTEVS